MAFTVYVSHSTSPWELAHVYALADEGARRGLRFYVPDRTWNPQSLPGHISVALSQADIVLIFATLGGHHQDWVNLELSALSQGRPVIALVDLGIELQGIAPADIVWLDRENIAGSMQLILNRLQSLRLTRETTNLLAGFLVGTLALLVLREFTKKDKGRS
jgi:hypothetical protein